MATPKTKFEENVLAPESVREAAVTNLVNNLLSKQFKSGKTGYYTQGKVTVDGVRYQAQMQLVKIESK